MKSVLLLFVLVPLLHGCYYMQAAAGQWEVLRKREPIDEVIADPATPGKLADRLELLKAARDFSIEELGLPDNGSYRTYADIERDYVVWNVFAAVEFSLQAKTWCYPVAGCVSYRGYFSKARAQKEARKLKSRGYDVAVGGVSAYSTLGRFDDPILNTMLGWQDVDIVDVLFHELAHQVVYVKGDTAFNESFATAVAEYGVRRWLESTGDAEAFEQYVAGREYQQRLMQIVKRARADLGAIYSGNVTEDNKRQQKQTRLAQLVAEVRREAAASGRKPTAWLSGDINNAHLISMALYEGQLPRFRRILADCDQDIHCFYARVRGIAEAAR